MRQPVLVLMLVAGTSIPAMAQTPLQRCKAITDSLERLRCYDAIEAEPAPAPTQSTKPAGGGEAAPAKAPPEQATAPKPQAASDDALIAKAKEAVLSELRDPASAQFEDLKVRTVRSKQAVCGLVNAKNSRGRMTGGQPFAFDGEHTYLVVYNTGPANSTKLDAMSLFSVIGSRLRNYRRLCP